MSGIQHLLEQARDEINHLRHINQILQAKVDVIEVFDLALRKDPGGSQGFGEDIAWKIQRAIDAIAAEGKDS